MLFKSRYQPSLSSSARALCLAIATVVATGPVSAGDMAFKQAVAEASFGNEGIATYYRNATYQPIWTGEGAQYQARRAALLEAMANVDRHGLPSSRYDSRKLTEMMRGARSVRDLGKVEVELSRAYLALAGDLESGVLEPRKIDDGLVRAVEKPSAEGMLRALSAAEPYAHMRALGPDTMQYRALMKEKMRLEGVLRDGGWGAKVANAKKLELGDTGNAVVALRNRLIRMGYMSRSAARSYDVSMQNAVRAFQQAHGLEQDGVAGPGTLAEINRTVSDRLKSVLVALERERWLPDARGDRHVLVNQTDFSAKIVDDGLITFETRAVIGKNVHDRRSPEFSDEMEHMVINPSWYVPRSIITKEYLPKLKANPNAVSHIEITDSRGRRVNRGAVDFNQFSKRSFPFAMRQPPGKSNALGLVKFMFPNQYNIYLHDTPQKALFARETRAFSHGCIRLAQPFDFAYALLARQEEDPKAFFHRVLNTGRETRVELEQHVPVHLIYRTAFIGPKGQAQFRRDVYGRDAKIWDALSEAGVVLEAVQG